MVKVLYGSDMYRRRKSREATTTVSVLAWFKTLLLAADKMPDTSDFIIPAGTKRDVYTWYDQDRIAHDTLYEKCSASFFNNIWSRILPNVKLRKYLRFTKCCYCVKWRGTRWSKQATTAQKAEAKEKLREHYSYIKCERAYGRAKQNQAIQEPDKYLSIAIDGCENLPHGLPHFPEVHAQHSIIPFIVVSLVISHANYVCIYIYLT